MTNEEAMLNVVLRPKGQSGACSIEPWQHKKGKNRTVAAYHSTLNIKHMDMAILTNCQLKRELRACGCRRTHVPCPLSLSLPASSCNGQAITSRFIRLRRCINYFLDLKDKFAACASRHSWRSPKSKSPIMHIKAPGTCLPEGAWGAISRVTLKGASYDLLVHSLT